MHMNHSILIEGGKKLFGNINISGAKNSALPIMAACLLTDSNIILKNIPEVGDIKTMLKLLSVQGVSVTNSLKNGELVINAKNINSFTAPYKIVSKMRASIWVLAPLLARLKKAKIALPGGCKIGSRQINLHLDVLSSMGANFSLNQGYINATAKELHGTKFHFNKISVGATISAIIAASIAKGESKFINCAQEPEVVDLCNFLVKMGSQIKGIGTKTISIIGTENLKATEYTIIGDRIEAGTYMIIAAITKSELNILNIEQDIVENLINKFAKIGIIIKKIEKGFSIKSENIIKPIDFETNPYPEFPTDMQAQLMSILTIADGCSIVKENIFENRFMHVPELIRMGADITVNNSICLVRGVTKLKGATVKATDLRASVALIIAGLASEGTTVIRNAYHLDRGYSNLESKLSKCGAFIKRIIH